MSISASKTSLASQWFCGGFGLLFLVIGIAILVGFSSEALYGYWRTREEVKVPATLRSFELREYRGKTGSHRYPEVSYEYQFQGKLYHGFRVALFETSDELIRLMQNSWRGQKALEVIIDPKDPEFAVIERDFRLGPVLFAMMSALFCMGLGGYLLRMAFMKKPS